MTYFSQLIKKSSIVSNPTFDRQKVDKLKDDTLVESITTTTNTNPTYLPESDKQKINDQSLSDFNDYTSSDKITENKPIKTELNIINNNPKNNIKKEPVKQQKIKQIDNFIKSNEYGDYNNKQKKSGLNDDNNFQELSKLSLSTSLKKNKENGVSEYHTNDDNNFQELSKLSLSTSLKKNKENGVSEYHTNDDNQANSFDDNNDKIQKKIYFNEIMDWVSEDNISYSNNNFNNFKEQESKNISSKIVDNVDKSIALNSKLKDLERKIEDKENIDYEISIGSINLNIEATQKKVKENLFNNQIKSEPNYHNRLRRSYLKI